MITLVLLVLCLANFSLSQPPPVHPAHAATEIPSTAHTSTPPSFSEYHPPIFDYYNYHKIEAGNEDAISRFLMTGPYFLPDSVGYPSPEVELSINYADGSRRIVKYITAFRDLILLLGAYDEMRGYPILSIKSRHYGDFFAENEAKFRASRDGEDTFLHQQRQGPLDKYRGTSSSEFDSSAFPDPPLPQHIDTNRSKTPNSAASTAAVVGFPEMSRVGAPGEAQYSTIEPEHVSDNSHNDDAGKSSFKDREQRATSNISEQYDDEAQPEVQNLGEGVEIPADATTIHETLEGAYHSGGLVDEEQLETLLGDIEAIGDEGQPKSETPDNLGEDLGNGTLMEERSEMQTRDSAFKARRREEKKERRRAEKVKAAALAAKPPSPVAPAPDPDIGDLVYSDDDIENPNTSSASLKLGVEAYKPGGTIVNLNGSDDEDGLVYSIDTLNDNSAIASEEISHLSGMNTIDASLTQSSHVRDGVPSEAVQSRGDLISSDQTPKENDPISPPHTPAPSVSGKKPRRRGRATAIPVGISEKERAEREFLESERIRSSKTQEESFAKMQSHEAAEAANVDRTTKADELSRIVKSPNQARELLNVYIETMQLEHMDIPFEIQSPEFLAKLEAELEPLGEFVEMNTLTFNNCVVSYRVLEVLLPIIERDIANAVKMVRHSQLASFYDSRKFSRIVQNNMKRYHELLEKYTTVVDAFNRRMAGLFHTKYAGNLFEIGATAFAFKLDRQKGRMKGARILLEKVGNVKRSGRSGGSKTLQPVPEMRALSAADLISGFKSYFGTKQQLFSLDKWTTPKFEIELSENIVTDAKLQIMKLHSPANFEPYRINYVNTVIAELMIIRENFESVSTLYRTLVRAAEEFDRAKNAKRDSAVAITAKIAINFREDLKRQIAPIESMKLRFAACQTDRTSSLIPGDLESFYVDAVDKLDISNTLIATVR